MGLNEGGNKNLNIAHNPNGGGDSDRNMAPFEMSDDGAAKYQSTV